MLFLISSIIPLNLYFGHSRRTGRQNDTVNEHSVHTLLLAYTVILACKTHACLRDRIYGNGTLSERCSLIALEKKCAALTGCTPDAASLFAAFRTDGRVRDIVRESAEQLGYYVNNLVNGTGVDCVIVGGECKAFGDLYLDAVRAVSDKFCTHPAPIRFERGDAPSVSGMMDTARRFAVDRIVGSGAAADIPPCEKS